MNILSNNFALRQRKSADAEPYNEKSRVVFVTASNGLYRDVCNYNKDCAERYGNFDKVVVYDVDTQIDSSYKKKHAEILNTKRGAGLWLWKIYFIEKAFREECNEGDILFYADAASFFFRSVKPLIEQMHSDIFAVSLPYIEEEFTKREAFELMGLNSEEYTKTRQFHASFMAFRKNDTTKHFVEEWKSFCEDIRILSQDVYFGEQMPTFCAHRNDQSIFSLLCKKYGVQPSQDPSQYGVTGYGCGHGKTYMPLAPTTSFPFCIMLHKQREWNSFEKMKNWLRIYKRFIIIFGRRLTRREEVYI